jgi:hypothetical protein
MSVSKVYSVDNRTIAVGGMKIGRGKRSTWRKPAITLKMEAVCSAEKSVTICRTRQRHGPEDRDLLTDGW